MPPKRGLALLLLPASAVILAFLACLVLLAWRSLTPGAPGGPFAVYQALLQRPDYIATLIRTLRIAATVTILCVVIGYPMAWCIARARRWRSKLLVLVLLPWMVSVVVRTYGWVVLLGNRGTLNSLLQALGITDAPVRMLFNQVGVTVGLVHVFCPFMILSLLAVMVTLDRALEEAAMSLGAGPFGTFRRVLLPLTAPGLAAGASVVFLLSTGAVVTPLLLGGPRDPMLAMQVYQDVSQLYNYPRAAALAFVLMALAAALLLPLGWLERRLRPPDGAGA